MTDPRLRAFCRQLRRDSTDAERALWRRLRARRIGAKFRRQHALGPFIADFYCAAARLVVELDGGQHFEARRELDDARRTRWLHERGIRVLRFTNTEALREPDAVVDAIAAALA
jgi:very-short-patch-repair endonuclease